MVFRSAESTLTQEEVSAVMERIVEGIRAELDGTLRD
jgi:phenylalanyl-tRNA synthetase beta subunit